MVKKTITYTDYNGKERTEDFYFNLNKAELVEMEVSESGGLSETLKQIVETNDHKQLMKYFKEIVAKSYGVKSPDGKRFIKNADVLGEFMETEAFPTLFMSLAEDDGEAARFINGVCNNIK
jgi:hypothetical protein